MDSSDSGTPISSSDGDKVHLGGKESTLNGDLDFLGKLDSETNVSVSVSNSDDSLESGSLTGLGLLLDGEDAHDLVGELVLGVRDKSIDNRGLLDGDGVGIDLLEGLDLAGLHESSELGEWGPLVALEASSAHATGSSTSASAASSVSTSSSSESSSASLASFGGGSFSRCWGSCWCFHC